MHGRVLVTPRKSTKLIPKSKSEAIKNGQNALRRKEEKEKEKEREKGFC
jgi:hypothetical protein